MDRGYHVYGDPLPIHIDIPDSVTVKPGDIVFLARVDHYLNVGLRSSSGLTGYGYPLAAGSTDTSVVANWAPLFAGIAMDDSPKGSTDAISVGTAGVWELPLASQAGVTIGNLVKAQTPTGFDATASTTGSYQVTTVAHLGGGGSSGNSLGYVVKTKASAKSAFVQIRTATGPGGYIVDA